MRTPRVEIAEGVAVGGGGPLLLIAGPDTIESEAHALAMARSLARIAAERGMPFVFKASFDKANRTSIDSARGPGVDEGLRILARVKREARVAVTTDFHLPAQAASVAEVADLLQVPAFLSRQTDMLLAAARTGRAVNVKKGPFLAPWDVEGILGKLRSGGCAAALVTERGTTFGYNNLVVDFRGIPRMRSMGVPVCFDATHSVQLPGGQGTSSGGERSYVAALARAAVAVGVDALFFEVHDAPERAICDGPVQIPLGEFAALLDTLRRPEVRDDAR
jgi:2-dehydro-3-deoxyphosphooctonate aldolase (KDO 8-P synthase)